MTIFRCSSLVLCLALASCEQAPSEPPPSLTAEQQAERMQLCMAEIESWRSTGVWIHGGVEPAVNREAWAALDDSDQQKVADIAACIASAGRFEPQKVEIVSEGFKVPIEERESENLLFVERFRRSAS